MKRWICLLLGMAMLAAGAASAQEYVSVSEIYDQAQALGGVWQETFETKNGTVTIDVPVIVPDVDVMPVMTMEKANPSNEMFDQIASGKKLGKEDDHEYETEMNGEIITFFLGRDNYWSFGKKTDNVGYDAFQFLVMEHGGYRNSKETGMGLKRAEPRSFHYPWDIDPDTAYVRNNDITLNEAMRLWHEDLKMCYPDDDFVIRPTLVQLSGSTLAKDSTQKNKRDGYIVIEGAEQLIGGIPIMGAITEGCDVFGGASTAEKTKIEEKTLGGYRLGSYNVNQWNYFYGFFHDEENYRTSSTLARVRTMEYPDVPLASLDSVLESIKEKIESGNIRKIFSIKLGYILYSDPDMTDYAWAIPRWQVKADYVKDGMEKKAKYKPHTQAHVDRSEGSNEARRYFVNLPIDAQNGELIIFSSGSKKNAEVYAVPEIITWDDI